MEIGRSLAHRFISFVAKISYSMYLVNYSPVFGYLRGQKRWASFDGLFKFAVFWLPTIGLAYALYRWWEAPIMRLRERFSDAEF